MSVINKLRPAVSRTVERLVRFREIWEIFGPWSKYTWMTLFPPYRGWDVGCGYCALEEDAMRDGRCDRAKQYGYKKCGTTEKPNKVICVK